jgi:hypothetical protein
VNIYNSWDGCKDILKKYTTITTTIAAAIQSSKFDAGKRASTVGSYFPHL